MMKKYYPVRNVLFFLGEGCIIFLTINVIYFIFTNWRIPEEGLLLQVTRSLIVTYIFQLSLYFFDLYRHDQCITPTKNISKMVQAFGIGCIFLSGLYYLIPSLIISTSIFWTFYIVVCIILFGWRTLYSFILQKRLFTSPIIILGTGTISEKINKQLKIKHDSDYKVAAFVGSKTPYFKQINIPIISNPDSLLAICKKHHSDILIVAMDSNQTNIPIKDLMECKFHGITIIDGITFFESISGRILVEDVIPSWLVLAEGFQIKPLTSLIKRFIDITISTLGLLLSLPLSLLAALFIKLESAGPIFYWQERVGERGAIFSIFKFRSMYQDSEKNGAVWAAKNDSRITRTGNFIRKTRIDEIPQMWNVLKGEMSFVGPRPERPVFVNELEEKIPYYSLRHAIKPGITGLAQIRYPYGATIKDALRKLEYDMYYLKNLSVFFDLLIIFITIKIVLFQKGSR